MRSTRKIDLIAILCLMVSLACEITTPAPLSVTPTPVELNSPTFLSPTLPVTETFTPTPLPSTPNPTDTVTPLNLNPQVIVLAENLPEPDDLVLAPDGSIYISDVTAGTIQQYTPAGQLNPMLSGLRAPEGMAFLPDGSMVIAEQGTNRLLRYDFTSGTLTPFLDLVNHTSNLGVDGILWDG